MTEKLFDDSSLTAFEAKVTYCEKCGKGFEMTLDRSAFFPEGGGQKGDIGSISSAKVIDTYEKNGKVIHLCDSPIETGTIVRCQVDEPTRLRRMQEHSGEHLLMGFIHNKTGFDNVGFHLGSSYVTLDLNGEISEELLFECERLANEAIAADIPVTISYPSPGELSAITYRSKLEMTENVRLVTIEEIDVCACCAPHVRSTGMIGIIKVLSSERYKGGTRLHIVSGMDALEVFREKLAAVSSVSRLLSAKPEKIAAAAERLLNENNDLKARLNAIEKARAQELIESLDNPERKSFFLLTHDLDRIHMRSVANSAVKLTDGVACIFGEEEQGYTYILVSDTLPLREFVREFNKALVGKGGGTDRMAEGSISADREAIENYFSSLNKRSNDNV